MPYKRYKMLQKYVNSEAVEEYKQGELISETSFDTLSECNEGNQNPDVPIEENIYQWIVVSDIYECNDGNKYSIEKEQVSYDNGVTWSDTGRTRQGYLIETESDDCSQYRWVVVEGQYECIDYDKYAVEKKQQSTDGGTTWTDVVPSEMRTGELIEADSEYCGYVPPIPHDYSKDYLTFEVMNDEGGTITFTASSSSFTRKISYSLDNGQTWTDLESYATSETLGGTLSKGQKVLVKGGEIAYGKSSYYNSFGGTAKVNVYGNIMSLISGDDISFINNKTLTLSYTFYCLFYDYTNLLSAQHLVLPATTLEEYCYRSMFEGCTSLTAAPELPATTLVQYCYQEMFRGCTSLTAAPELPAETLAYDCYLGMFVGCTSLTEAPELPATTLTRECYSNMFVGCTSLTTAPELPSTTLGGYCYEYMFRGCTSLTTAPELPATTLASYCYYGMFRGCTSLTTAPELPATTLVRECYSYMFYDCRNLNYIKCLATDKEGTGLWVEGVSSSGTFVKAASISIIRWTTGVNGIPSGWTVEDA